MSRTVAVMTSDATYPYGQPPKRRINRWSIVLAALGGMALLCGGIIVVGALAARSTSNGGSVSAEVVPTTRASAAVAPPAGGTLSGGGVLLVPAEVKPGTYRATVPAGENCYWARLKGTSGSFEEILANGNAEGGQRVTVTVRATDKAFEFTPGCGTWTKIG